VIGGADGGAHSTLDDIDRFLRAYSDGTLLGPQQERVLARHADAGEGFFEGYGVHHYPDGRYGHGGGDPGVEVLANRWPDEDVNIVVLSNQEGDDAAFHVRNLVLDTWRG
jgi:hypothetical protein